MPLFSAGKLPNGSVWPGDSANGVPHESRHPPQLQSRGLPGRFFRLRVPDPLHALRQGDDQVGRRRNLSAGEAGSLQPVAPVLHRQAQDRGYRRSRGQVPPSLRCQVSSSAERARRVLPRSHPERRTSQTCGVLLCDNSQFSRGPFRVNCGGVPGIAKRICQIAAFPGHALDSTHLGEPRG